MENFFSQVGVNFLGTLLGGICLYFLLEKRLKKFERNRDNERLFKNIYSELIANLVIVDRIIATPSNLSNFPIARFKTRRIEDFSYARPVDNNDNFYLKIKGTVINLESDNSLLDLVFSQRNENAITANKQEILRSAPGVKAQIEELIGILTEIDKPSNYLKLKKD